MRKKQIPAPVIPHERITAPCLLHCHATNRVHAAQLGSAPDCGKCKKLLFTGQPVALDDASFDKHLTRNQIPLLVDFWAP